ncbi:MAG: biotin attachment protein [Proteobacteria bacterium]|nr:biotin attachment protein [Pseudomonadota bacterium]
MAKKKVKFMCTAFRDGFQSVYGARVLTEDFMPAVEAASEAGITWFEAGGGARFQSLYFYCNQDAFEMMDRFREAAGPDANLQTLARGTNVVGLESQPSDVIEMHAKLFKKHGITTIRDFDALNDVNNLVYSGKCIKEAGLKNQICVTMMELPPGCSGAHDPEFYMKTLKGILDKQIPFDSVCFKDASGTAVPSKVHETIKRARKLLPPETLIHFHTHETAGISVQGYMAALEAGADAIDLSLAPASGGTCQPDVAVMWHALRGTDYDLDIDIDKILTAEEVFKEGMSRYFTPPEATTVEPIIPWSPMPGGALTANTQMLRDNGIMDKYVDIIKAMSEVVRRGGFGTSVTPVSQFYYQQAFNNVMFGPWKKIADGYGNMVLGYFGKTPVPPDPEIVKIAAEQMGKEPTTRTPLDINNEDPKKGLKQARVKVKEEGIEETDENVFIVATCKDKGVAYLKGEAKLGIRLKEEAQPAAAKAAAPAPEGYTVTVNGNKYSVALKDNKATVDGVSYDVDVAEGLGEAKAAPAARPAAQPAAQPAAGSGTAVKAPMPGIIVRILKNVGDEVANDEVVMVIEAMKMEIEIKAPSAGKVASIGVSKGEQVPAGHTLATIA